jgi:hypothetical protein
MKEREKEDERINEFLSDGGAVGLEEEEDLRPETSFLTGLCSLFFEDGLLLFQSELADLSETIFAQRSLNAQGHDVSSSHFIGILWPIEVVFEARDRNLCCV